MPDEDSDTGSDREESHKEDANMNEKNLIPDLRGVLSQKPKKKNMNSANNSVTNKTIAVKFLKVFDALKDDAIQIRKPKPEKSQYKPEEMATLYKAAIREYDGNKYMHISEAEANVVEAALKMYLEHESGTAPKDPADPAEFLR